MKHSTPADIEKTSMGIIEKELREQGLVLDAFQAPVIKRVIHTTADFTYADTLVFSSDAISSGVQLLVNGASIVTDTNMAKAGISKRALAVLGGSVLCHMAEPEVANEAKEKGTTRAVVSMQKASLETPDAIFAIGNGPTALLELVRLMDESGFRPKLVIGVPVGFVNVVESKEALRFACDKYGVPYIINMGRKGGSTVAAAICNALLYLATDSLDPEKRTW